MDFIFCRTFWISGELHAEMFEKILMLWSVEWTYEEPGQFWLEYMEKSPNDFLGRIENFQELCLNIGTALLKTVRNGYLVQVEEDSLLAFLKKDMETYFYIFQAMKKFLKKFLEKLHPHRFVEEAQTSCIQVIFEANPWDIKK